MATDNDQQLSPRERRRQQRIEVGREQILDTAEELFGENGYRGTSLQQVADRCEFSVGALYLFFERKDVLFEAILERRGTDQFRVMKDAVAGPGSGLDALLRLFTAIIDFHRQHRGFGRLSARITTPGLEGFPNEQSFQERFAWGLSPAVEAIERGQHDGSVRAGDPRVLSRLFSSIISAHHSMDPNLLGLDDGVVADVDQVRDFVRQAFAALPGAE